MKALVLHKPGHGSIETIPEPVARDGDILLKVRMVGFCGSDLNSFRGLNPLVSFPRIPGHEVSATIVKADRDRADCRNRRSYFSLHKLRQMRVMPTGTSNACQFNETLGVQRDGALTELIAMPPEKLYPAKLSTKELCLVEPLTVGFHAVSRGRVTADDTVANYGLWRSGAGRCRCLEFSGCAHNLR